LKLVKIDLESANSIKKKGKLIPKSKWIANEENTRFIPINLSFILSERIDTGTPNKRVTGIAYILANIINPGISLIVLCSMSIKQKPIIGIHIITVNINANNFLLNISSPLLYDLKFEK